jgi:hypothetical protein
MDYVCSRHMKKRRFLAGVIAVLATYFWSTVPLGCANIVPPLGGARDSLPPVLLKVDPPDSTVNFNHKTITLNFNENVDLKDPYNNIIFTPTFKKLPQVDRNLKTITIKFTDTLDPGTTYVINFGDAIADVNEGNVLRNYTYVFSTGPALDSLELNGNVLLAETGGIDSAMVAVLYRNLVDTIIRTEPPKYIVKLDHNGAFHFHNLPADSFALYIFDAQAKRYNDRNHFAFTDRPVVPGRTDSLLLYAYIPKPAESGQPATGITGLGAAGRITGADRRLRFNQVTQGQQDLLTDYVLNFPVPLKTFDSSKLHFTTDSSFTPAPFSVSLDSSRKELRFKTAWKENTRYNLVLDKDFAADTAGRQLLKTDTLFFNTKKLTDYGKLALRIRNIDLGRHPVVQFVQNNVVVYSAPIPSGTFNSDLFIPGEYELRILYDTNNNGKWDRGQFFGIKKQPEIVVPLSQRITVKGNWDNEFER